MFDALLESGHGRPSRVVGGGVLALLAHVAVTGAALWTTAHGRSATRPVSVSPVIVWPPEPAQPGRPLGSPEPISGPTGLPVPSVPPVALYRMDAGLRLDMRQWAGVVDRGPAESRLGSDGNGPWSVDAVEEPPVLLAASPPVYPEMLRRAGITGRVIVEAVIDTIGGAEPGSVRVIQSVNAGFDEPARDYLLRAVFRPARVHGRPVRVLVRVPIDFALRRRT